LAVAYSTFTSPSLPKMMREKSDPLRFSHAGEG
jgi:hypothetical protein